jgi:hypothetical protein
LFSFPFFVSFLSFLADACFGLLNKRSRDVSSVFWPRAVPGPPLSFLRHSSLFFFFFFLFLFPLLVFASSGFSVALLRSLLSPLPSVFSVLVSAVLLLLLLPHSFLFSSASHSANNVRTHAHASHLTGPTPSRRRFRSTD